MSHTPTHIEQQEQLQDIIISSGSSAMTKNSYGVTFVNGGNINTSLLYKSLQIDKLNQAEIEKAIDVEVKELRPVTASIRLDLVPRPLYDEQVALVGQLQLTISDLQNTIDQLNSTILGLQSEVDASEANRLNTEITNDSIVNQLDALSDTVDDSGQQISTAIQKSIEESILRASLQAQNEGFKAQISTLIKQIDSLNAIIEGLQAQLGALQQQKLIEDSAQTISVTTPGSKVVNDIVAVGPSQRLDAIAPSELFAKFKAGASAFKWVNGITLKFNSSDTAPVTVTLTKNLTTGGDWFRPSESTFTMPPQSSKEITLLLIYTSQIRDLDSRRKKIGMGYTGSKRYTGGVLTVTVRRANGTTKEPVTFTLGFEKTHPNSYG